MKFDRQDFLNSLLLLQPGTDSREIIEQMGHVMFSSKQAITYNDQISIAVPLETNFNCSVNAEKLIKILQSMATKTVGVSKTKNELRLVSKDTKAGISIMVEDELADIIRRLHDDIESAKWKKLPSNFIEGVSLCAFSASSKDEDRTMTCVRCNGDVIYAGDRSRCSKYIMDGKVSDFLIKATIVKDLKNFSPVKYYRSESWIHFKTKDNVVFSCRRMSGKFLDYAKIFKMKSGTKIKIPNIKKEVDATEIMTSKDGKQKNIGLVFKKGLVVCLGASGSGWVEKPVKIDYKGKELTIRINPIFLSQVLERATTVRLTKEKAFFESGNFEHVIGLFTK
jgi:hypothetical protein